MGFLLHIYSAEVLNVSCLCEDNLGEFSKRDGSKESLLLEYWDICCASSMKQVSDKTTTEKLAWKSLDQVAEELFARGTL